MLVIMKKTGIGAFNQFIVETSGTYGTGATLTEVRAYDAGETQLPLTINPDNMRYFEGDMSNYWQHSPPGVWDYTNLIDDDITYTDNTTGSASSTLFNAGETNSTTCWVRFLCEVTNASASKVSIWVGSPEGRIPREVKIYGINSGVVFDPDVHLISPTTTGLTLKGTIVTQSNWTSVQREDIII